MERSGYLPLQIPPQEAMFAMYPSLSSILDVELPLFHPGLFLLSFDKPPDLSTGSLPDLGIFSFSQ
jgi:hypothetical protein